MNRKETLYHNTVMTQWMLTNTINAQRVMREGDWGKIPPAEAADINKSLDACMKHLEGVQMILEKVRQ